MTKSGTLYYPIWLSYAAAWAERQQRFDVHLLDAVAQRLSIEETVQQLAQLAPEVVFCDSSTPSIAEDLATAGAIKQALSNCRVVLVGTHATALPEEVLQSGAADAVLRGEYDAAAVAFADACAAGDDWAKVPGLSFLRDGKIAHTPEPALIDDLDTFPFISEVYHRHLRIKDYFFAAARHPMTMIVTSRGCPHRCGWCLYPQVMHRGKYRQRSAANVAEEFAFISGEMPFIREVGIEDDLFTGSKTRLRDICRQLIAQNNRLPFWCDTRVDLDYETMRLMKAAGCRLLITGFESGAQSILDTIDKGTRTEQALAFAADARRARLLVHGCFVLGNPGETAETMQQTLDFAVRLDPDSAQFFPMMVYPGTRMFDWARKAGCLRTADYRQWLTPAGLHDTVVDLPGLPGVEVRRFCDHARREFYLRRRYMLRKLGQSLLNRHEAKRNAWAFCRLARHLLRAS